MSNPPRFTSPDRDDLAERARKVGAAVVPYLVALYTTIAVLYLLAPPLRPGWVYAAVSFSAAALTLATYPLFWRASVARVHALLLAVAGIGVGYALGFVLLTGAPEQTVVLVIALIGTACLLFDFRAQVALVIASTAVWLLVARGFEPSVFAHWAVNLASAALLSMLVIWSRLRVLRGLERERVLAIEARRLSSEQAHELEAQARKLEKARADAVASVRAKDQFLANMSHELRTPLTSVIGASDLLLDGSLNEQQREYVEMVRRSGEMLARRIGDVLDFADLGAGRTAAVSAEFDFRAVLDRVVEVNRPTAREKGLTLRALIDEDVPRRARGDGERVGRVLENLLSNAVRFTERGTVSLAVAVSERRGKRATVRVEVRDTGEGMSPEELETAFDPFSQADVSMTRTRGGLGLGLALSRAMVELMGGAIGARSEAGSGSVFWFELPLGLVSSAGREVRTAARVLVVEDDPINQQVIAAMVAHLGYRPEIAGGGSRALEMLASGNYGAVLMDCMMPEMDGYETAAAIRSRELNGSRIPIIALTANAQRGARSRSMDAGMDDHLTKPVEQQVLARVLSRWIDGPRGNGGAGPPNLGDRSGGRAPNGANGEAPESSGSGVLGGAPIDRTVLSRLRALGGGERPDLLAGLVDLFVERAPGKVAAMRDAITVGALQSASEAAHSLKSSSAMIGATNLASLCSEMEKRADERETDDASRLLTELDQEVSRVVEALRAI